MIQDMDKRRVVIDAVEFRRPAYVPWSWVPTHDCALRLREKLGGTELESFIQPHFADFGAGELRVEWTKGDFVGDVYGVVWDRTVDKDIGTPSQCPIASPADLASYRFPDADNPAWYAGMAEGLQANPHRFTRFLLGFSLFERAWTLRGMENLLIDMIENPAFVDDLLDAIVEHNLAQLKNALAFPFDCVHFGDDYGSQLGLIMGLKHWRRFIKPRLARMFGAVRQAGKYVSLHSCGHVQEAFDDLVEIGLQMFNPFQPEVMDTFDLMKRYHGRLAFHGGMSVQKVLPFGSQAEVRQAAQALLAAGAEGGFVFSPSHAVPRDAPPENLIAMQEVLMSQKGLV